MKAEEMRNLLRSVNDPGSDQETNGRTEIAGHDRQGRRSCSLVRSKPKARQLRDRSHDQWATRGVQDLTEMNTLESERTARRTADQWKDTNESGEDTGASKEKNRSMETVRFIQKKIGQGETRNEDDWTPIEEKIDGTLADLIVSLSTGRDRRES